MAITTDKLLVDVQVRGARDITALKDNIDNLGNKLTTLSGIIAGIGFGSLIKGAMDAADAIVDLSDATGIAIGNLVQFEKAFELAGGRAGQAGKAVTTFYQQIEAAADGSLKVRDAFAKVNVSLDDLRTLSEGDLLRKTIQGLSEMAAGSDRSATAALLLSKAFRTVDPKKLQEVIDQGGDFSQLEESYLATADAIEAMEKAMSTLKIAALQTFSPIAKAVADMKISAEDGKLALQILGGILAATFAVKTVQGVIAVVEAMRKLNTVMKTQVALQAAATALQGPSGLVKLGAAAVAAGASIYGLNQLLEDNAEAQEDAAQASIAPQPQPSSPANRTMAEDPRQRAFAESQARIDAARAEIDRINALRQAQGSELGKIEVESQTAIAKARADIFSKQYLSEEQKAREFSAKVGEINAKRAADEARVQNDLYLKRFQSEQEFRDEVLNGINAQQDAFARALLSANRQTLAYEQSVDVLAQRLQLENQSINLSTIDADLQRKIFDTEQDRLSRIREINQQVEDGTLEYDKSLQIIDRINAANSRTVEILKQQAEIQRQRQQDPIAGIQESLRRFAEEDTPFKMAQRQVESVFSSMENAIDNFVETGKFKFGDFARSIIQDLIKIELKAQATSILRGIIGRAIGGGFGTGSGFGNMDFGGFFANGGTLSPGKVGIVGERGPELISGPATITPMDKLAAPVEQTSVTYNINAVDATSFRSMIARDPEFLYAVTEQGRRSQPSRRRI